MTTTSMHEWCRLNGITGAAVRSLEARDIRALALPIAVRSALNSAGVRTVGQLVAKPWLEVWAIASIDAAGIETVQKAVRRFVFGAIEARLRRATLPIAIAGARRRSRKVLETPAPPGPVISLAAQRLRRTASPHP